MYLNPKRVDSLNLKYYDTLYTIIVKYYLSTVYSESLHLIYMIFLAGIFLLLFVNQYSCELFQWYVHRAHR